MDPPLRSIICLTSVKCFHPSNRLIAWAPYRLMPIPGCVSDWNPVLRYSFCICPTQVGNPPTSQNELLCSPPGVTTNRCISPFSTYPRDHVIMYCRNAEVACRQSCWTRREMRTRTRVGLEAVIREVLSVLVSDFSHTAPTWVPRSCCRGTLWWGLLWCR